MLKRYLSNKRRPHPPPQYTTTRRRVSSCGGGETLHEDDQYSNVPKVDVYRELRRSSRPTFLRESALEASRIRRDDQESDICLGCPCDHVLDEVSVARSINNCIMEGWGLELPQSNIDGDTPLTLCLELVQYPCVFKGRLAHLGRLLLKLLDRSFIDTPKFINQMTGCRRLPGVDVADNHQVDVRLFLTHLRLLCGEIPTGREREQTNVRGYSKDL